MTLLAGLALLWGPAQDLAREIDRTVHDQFLRFERAAPAPRSDDGEFLRRVMLDLVGRPPAAEELRAFVSDPGPGKRIAMVDSLLASDRFAESWARRLAADLLEDPPPSLVDWIRDGLRRDRPYDRMAADLIGALGKAEENPVVAYALARRRQDAPAPAFVEDVSRHFLGIDVYCARCHDHPFDRWLVGQYYGLAAFAVRRRAGPEGLTEGAAEDWTWVKDSWAPSKPSFLLGGTPEAGESGTAALARLVSAPGNLQFSRAAANRFWGWLSDRPLVDPPWEFDLRNRGASRRLLEVLAKGFDAGGRSVKSFVRAVCASETYQRGSAHPERPARYDFTRVRVRPLSGDQLRASAEIATLGKIGPGMPGPADPALFVRAGAELREWIRTGPVLSGIRAGPGTVEEKVEAMFLAALSRKPSAVERDRVAAFVRERGEEGFEEAYGALLNTAEFLSRR